MYNMIEGFFEEGWRLNAKLFLQYVLDCIAAVFR